MRFRSVNNDDFYKIWQNSHETDELSFRSHTKNTLKEQIFISTNK